MKWISVKDKLPENFVKVIVLIGIKKEIAISSIQYQNITTASNEILKIKTWEGQHNQQVTHWMKLPKPQQQ